MSYFTDEHRLFRQSMRDFLAAEVTPNIDTWEEVGDACEMEIATRLETQRVGDTERVYGLDEGKDKIGRAHV